MRTTIEMSNQLRSELLKLAAQKGEKGFSNIVQEAVAVYLASSKKTGELQQKARKLKGSLGGADVKHIGKATLKIRNSWR